MLGYEINFFYISILFSYLLIISSEEIIECPKNSPILNNNICKSKFCTLSEYISGICIISNNIIKTQWLNNLISIADLSFKYVNFLFDFDDNLIISSCPYDNKNDTDLIYKSRIFFGIKQNGRNYFYNYRNNLFEITKSYTLNNPRNKQISEACIIKIQDEDNIGVFYNYNFFIGLTDAYRELYDFENNVMKGGSIGDFFGDNPTTKRYYIEVSDNKNEILFVFNGIINGNYKLMFKGYSLRYSDGLKTTKYTYQFIDDVSNTGMCSCLKY